MNNKKDEYLVILFPKMRRFAIDAGLRGHRKHIIHGLIEVDVTKDDPYLRRLNDQ